MSIPRVSFENVGQENNPEAEAIAKAQELNKTRAEVAANSRFFGFSEAVFWELPTWKWSVCIVEASINNNSSTISNNNSSSSLSSSASSNIPYSPIVDAVIEIIQSIPDNKEHLVNPDEVILNLNKLIIYLLKSDPEKWPFRNTPAVVAEQFISYKKDYLDKKHYSVQNQTKFNTFVSNLSKVLNEQSMTIDDISRKIITKSARTKPVAPSGVQLMNRIKQLLSRGTNLIFWPNFADKISMERNERTKSIETFCRVFSHHAYVYKPDADNELAQADFNTAVDRLVEILIAYDHQNNTSILFNLTKYLLTTIEDSFKGTLMRNYDLSSLVWTFETLVKNSRFIKYMQPYGKKNDEIASKAAILFYKEKTWKAIADLVINLGDKNLFNKVLKNGIGDSGQLCLLSQDQINTIFHNINSKMGEANSVFSIEYPQMLMAFMTELAKSNKLHFLKPYASHPNHHLLLQQNLVDLDFSFMGQNGIPLETFFSNAGFRSIHDKDINIPLGMNVKRTLISLFSQNGKNPVVNREDLNNALGQALADFNDGFEYLCETILSKIGESSLVGREGTQLMPAERWLSTNALTVYNTLKAYVFKCLPLNWETEFFNDEIVLLQRLCIHEGKFYLIKANDNRDIVLEDIFTSTVLQGDKPPSVLVTETYQNVKNRLIHEMQSARENREGVSSLTENYMPIHNHQYDKVPLESLLGIIFKKMQDDRGLVTFLGRLVILSNFFHVMAPFYAQVNKLTQKRFFKNDKLKNKVAINVKLEAGKIGQNVDTFLPNLNENSDEAFTPETLNGLASLVSRLCTSEIEKILLLCSLSQLSKASSQFENVICRRIDEISYSKEEFKKSFCEHAGNRNQDPNVDLTTIIGDLAVKEQIMEDYGNFLRKREPIPVNFILPNQALAIQLCTCPQFQDRNSLIKLGTGQGKSLVIATAALNEARKIRNNPKGFVFVFTSYDHLAQRDHEFGVNFFKKDNIESLCISSIDDIPNFSSRTKIIYADIQNIDSIVQHIMVKLLKNTATEKEKEFIKVVYGSTGEDIRIILDEYDLLLFDLEKKDPFVTKITSTFMPVDFVKAQRAFCPFLATMTEEAAPARPRAHGSSIDPNTGKDYHTVSFYNHHNQEFHLYASVMRLSKLILRAKRVIGLSGTALESENHSLDRPLFFEIPSSQNPEVFGTEIQKDKSVATKSESFISRHQEIKLDFISRERVEGRNEKIFVLTQSVVNQYCSEIVNDIKKNRVPIQKEATYKRPILIFCDPTFEYRIEGSPNNQNGSPVIKRLWDTLKEAIIQAGITPYELSNNVLDEDLQKIARSGEVTLTTIKYGRGADIRVSLDIEEGLHVIVGTSVVHERLLHQLIGRTGRMGRQGTYSAITIGDLIIPQTTAKKPFYAALHELSKIFVEMMLSPGYDADTSKKWLLFLTNCAVSEEINEDHAIALCGASVSDNNELKNYFG